MKIRTIIYAGFVVGGSAAWAQYAPSTAPAASPVAQPYGPPPAQYAAPSGPQYAPNQYNQYNQYGGSATPLAPAQLDQLLSPIALYPDPLIGVMLPAATHPDQIEAAASLGGAAADPNQLAQQPWDDSVKALAQYPEVAAWMAQNADWTGQLGTAVATEEPAVFDSIQRLRANARANGLLVDTPQQRVETVNGAIAIVPAQPNTVYVPNYDPQYVIAGGGAQPGSLTFGLSYALGALAYGLDWGNHSVWMDRGHRGHSDSLFSFFGNRGHETWRPPTEVRHDRVQQYSSGTVARPAPFAERSTRWHSNQTQVVTPTGRADERQFYRGQPQVNYGVRDNRGSGPAPVVQPNRDRHDDHDGRTNEERRRDDEHRDDDHRRRDSDDHGPDR